MMLEDAKTILRKKALAASKRFTAPKPIQEIAKHAQNHLSLANQAGEGWFLTGEMVEVDSEWSQ